MRYIKSFNESIHDTGDENTLPSLQEAKDYMQILSDEFVIPIISIRDSALLQPIYDRTDSEIEDNMIGFLKGYRFSYHLDGLADLQEFTELLKSVCINIITDYPTIKITTYTNRTTTKKLAMVVDIFKDLKTLKSLIAQLPIQTSIYADDENKFKQIYSGSGTLSTYENFVNEKMNLKEIKDYISRNLKYGILPAILLFQLTPKCGKQTSYDLLKQAIKDSRPSEVFKKEIQNAREDVVLKAQKFNDPTIINSIRSIKINMGKTSGNDVAEFIAMPNEEPIIILDETNIITMDSASIEQSIAHELFHYLDHLIGGNSSFSLSMWSQDNLQKLNLLNLEVLSDKNRARNILYKLLTGYDASEVDPTMGGIEKTNQDPAKDRKNRKALDDMFETIWNNREYYTKSTEFFVRFQVLKRTMWKKKFIKNINDPLTEESLIELFNDLREHPGQYDQVLPIIIFINLNVDNLNKIAMLSSKEEINKA